ncbi:DUF3152 domain-containing protein [uncultured Jatrophihabitans sp.]|uniref:DUF3152 domain-containing protein n=1 Tax=uncultured Jatrophihabitans sp. TaxID=1610747 RepID=UPI0035CBB031
MTRPRDERDPLDDVRAAHDGARRTEVGFGRRRPPESRAGNWLRAFVRRWGWRAYAIPVLAVVTIVALVTSSTASSPSKAVADRPTASASARRASPPPAPAEMPLKGDVTGAGDNSQALKGYALPNGPAYTTKGAGTFRVLRGTSPVVGKGRLYRYSIDVENGVSGIDLTQFQSLVVSTLSDPRSWSGHGVSLQRVDSGRIDFHVTLTSSMTVRKYCGYSIPVETSCYAAADSVPGLNDRDNRVIFNDARWVRGSTAYVGDLALYRIYMINHEDGHALGHNHAHQCLPGGLAPAMMQQSFGLRSAVTKQICQANPWPYPPGVRGAPGAEQVDTSKNDEYKLGD